MLIKLRRNDLIGQYLFFTHEEATAELLFWTNHSRQMKASPLPRKRRINLDESNQLKSSNPISLSIP